MREIRFDCTLALTHNRSFLEPRVVPQRSRSRGKGIYQASVFVPFMSCLQGIISAVRPGCGLFLRWLVFVPLCKEGYFDVFLPPTHAVHRADCKSPSSQTVTAMLDYMNNADPAIRPLLLALPVSQSGERA